VAGDIHVDLGKDAGYKFTQFERGAKISLTVPAAVRGIFASPPLRRLPSPTPGPIPDHAVPDGPAARPARKA
jgi:hypothetical protein